MASTARRTRATRPCSRTTRLTRSTSLCLSVSSFRLSLSLSLSVDADGPWRGQNALHYEWTMRALEAGKHVLLEKPAGNTAEEVERMFAYAKKKNLVRPSLGPLFTRLDVVHN